MTTVQKTVNSKPKKASKKAPFKPKPAKVTKNYNVALATHFPRIAAGTPTSHATNNTLSPTATLQARSEFYLAQSMGAIRQAARKSLTPQAERHGVTLEDLESVGYLAVIEAVAKYQEDQASFLGYAANRIRGSMVDHIRSCCPAPRSQTDKIKERLIRETAIAEGKATGPSMEDVQSKDYQRKEVNISMALAVISPLSLDAAIGSEDFSGSDHYTLHDVHDFTHTLSAMHGGGINAEERMQLKDVIDRMSSDKSAMGSLSLTPRERIVLDLVLQGFNHKEISARLNVNASRVAQIVSELTRKMTTFASLESFADVG